MKYKCNTTKTLEMSRVFLVEKEKEKEQVRKNIKHTETDSQLTVITPLQVIDKTVCTFTLQSLNLPLHIKLCCI